MKKNLTKTFSKILSLALVMTLMLTTILSAACFTASAESSVITNKNFHDFEGGVIPSGNTVSSTTRFTIATDIALGTYSLKHTPTSGVATYNIKSFEFEVGKTYIISGYHYVAVAADGTGDYSWFRITNSKDAIIKDIGGKAEGAWHKFSVEYTCDTEDDYIKINANKSELYFDDIYIYESTAYESENLPLATDFSNIETVDTLPVLGSDITRPLHFEYDEELGKNIAVVTVPKLSGTSFVPIFSIPYKLKAGVSYTYTIRYKTEMWCTGSINSMASNLGGYDKSTWTTKTVTLNPTTDGQFLSTYVKDCSGGKKFYISEIILREDKSNTNSAKQVYDFDNATLPEMAATYTVTTGKKGVPTAASKVTKGMDKNCELDFPLIAGESYRISFDYKGTGGVRFLPNSGGWANEMYHTIGTAVGNDCQLSSDTWARCDTVFTAKYNSTHIWWGNWKADSTIYIDNITIQLIQNNNTTSKQTYDFDNTSFAAQNPSIILNEDKEGNDTYVMDLSADSVKREKNSALEYNLTAGNVYKLSYDYKGTGSVRIIPNTGGWGKEMYSAEQEIDNYNKDLALSSPDVWSTHSTVFTAEYSSTHLFFVNFAKNSTIYFDNIVIEDVTADYDTKNYINDFETEDKQWLVETAPTLTEINYEDDADYGKVTKITYSGTNGGNFGWVKIPIFRLMPGESYRVKITYKADGWLCSQFNGATQSGGDYAFGNPNIDDPAVTEWTNEFFTITVGEKPTAYAIGTHLSGSDKWNRDISIWIAEIAIEKVGEMGDLNNDAKIDSADLVLMRQWLMGQVSGYNMFEYCVDIKEDGVKDLKDLVRLKRVLAGLGEPTTIIVDECSEDVEFYSSASNILKTDNNLDLQDVTRYRLNKTGKEGYIIYYAEFGLKEAAIRFDKSDSVIAAMTVYVSEDQSDWTEVTPETVTAEPIHYNSWISGTNYYGDLSGKYLKIVLPDTLYYGICKVYINGLNSKALSTVGAQNTDLRDAVTIYVSNDGNDKNDGLTPETALATLDAAITSALVPGDTVALACGDTFNGGALLTASGTADAPITITSYGEGEKPVITNFAGSDALSGTGLMVTGEYIEVSNLAFTDSDGYSAIDFYAYRAGATKGLKVEDCDFYEINNRTGSTKIAKECGAVHFLAKGAEPTWFDGITVKNNTFESVARTAVFTTSEWSAIDKNQKNWGIRNLSYGDGSPFFSENIVVSHNKINNNGGDAIVLIGTKDALIEHNVVSKSHFISENLKKASFANIWCHSSVGCVMQYNEVYGTTGDYEAIDLNSFDIDISCSDCIIQYNYSHENEGAFAIVCCDDGVDGNATTNSIIRYNVSVDDGLGDNRAAIELSSGIDGVLIHNNTIVSKNTDRFFIIADYAGVEVGPKNIKFYNNLFYGANSDPSAIGYGGDSAVADQITVGFYNNVFRNVENLPWNYTDLWVVTVKENNIETTDILLGGITDFIENTTITKGVTSVYETVRPVEGSELLTAGYDMSKVYDGFTAVDYTGKAYSGNLIGAIGG